MIQTGISFDSSRTEAWLEAIRKQRLLTGLACHADAFEQTQPAKAISASALPCILLQDITDDDTEGIFALSKSAEKALYASVFQAMNSACLKASAVNFTLPFRLDRIQEDEWQTRSQYLLEILQTLLSSPMPNDFTIQLPVQLPKPFPQSLEISRALELCNLVNAMPREKWDASFGINEMPPLTHQSSCGLCLHVHPDNDSVLDEFKATLPLELTKSIIFHYDVSANETLFDDEQAQWADYLKSSNFCGNVIFAPVSCPDTRLNEICEDAAGWSVMYQ